MSLTEIYVDPAQAADSGDGSIGSPYGDLEYAIEQETFDTTNGTRINIKAGTDEVLAAKLETALADTSVSAAWVPSDSAPLVIQGYTSAAGDGGIGGISGGGSVSIFADGTITNTYLIDLHLHNTGANVIVDLGHSSNIIRCEINNNSSGTAVVMSVDSAVLECYAHNCASRVIDMNAGVVARCYVEVSVNEGILVGDGFAYRNIVSVTGGATGIEAAASKTASVVQNSIYGAASSGIGIEVDSGCIAGVVENNLIEGFSDTGGIGLLINDANALCAQVTGNSVYNCETAYSFNAETTSLIAAAGGSNETLSASPFTDAANGDFSPVDTGNVKEGGLPNIIGGGLV